VPPLPLVIAPAGRLQSQLQRPEFLLQSPGLRGLLSELKGRARTSIKFERLGQPIQLEVWDSARHFRLGSPLDFPGLCKGYGLASGQ
jgi:hypothetical protein